MLCRFWPPAAPAEWIAFSSNDYAQHSFRKCPWAHPDTTIQSRYLSCTVSICQMSKVSEMCL